MHQFKLTVIGLFCLLLLAGCGADRAADTPFTEELTQDILDSSAFTDTLDELDGDTAWLLYGLDSSGLERQNLTDCVVFRSAGATCEELALLSFETDSQAAAALESLETYLQNQIESNESYRPQEIPKLENAFLEQRSSTVLLVVSADTDCVKDLVG